MAEATLEGVTNIIRKPETRTAWSDFYVHTLKRYGTEMYTQQPLPELLKRFQTCQGVIVLTGSSLRGTARPTSDWDVTFWYDSTLDDKRYAHLYRAAFESILNGKVEIKGVGEEKLHDLPLDTYTNGQLEEDQRLNLLKEERKVALKDEPIGEDGWPVHTNIDTIAPWVHMDTSKMVTNMPQEAFDNFELRNIVHLLTTTPELVFETQPGALRYHQKKIVQSLYAVWKTDRSMAETILGHLNHYLKESLAYTGSKHPEYEKQLIRDYISRKTNIPEGQMDRAVHLLRLIRSTQKFPPIPVMVEGFGIEK